VIASNSEANADFIVSGLRAAFENKNTAGIILRINSPGGSPVQAGYVNDEIKNLRDLHPDIPLYAVITDICTSGGYYIAASADKIYANKASIVGSIGVIMSSFGFVEALEKLGVERRLLHAGENKGFLDPFSPLRSEEVAHIDQVLNEVYQQFIEVVKQGRGERLSDDEKIFSGLIWTGEQSLELGLIDGLGSAGYVAREVIGVEEIIDFTHRETYLDRFANQLGATIARMLNTKLELR
jgi:protease-4